MAADLDLIPDATGALTSPTNLRPLDMNLGTIEADDHRAWASSPNTDDDVPHWRCYTSPQRGMRLRQLFAASASTSASEGLLDNGRDDKRILDSISKRGLLTWLREWAEGGDAEPAASALKFILNHRNLPDVFRARVVPTTDGMRALSDKNIVFLHQEEGIDVEGSIFVDPDFLTQPGVEKALRDLGFRDLDPLAILKARLAKLPTAQDDAEQLSKLWDAVLEVSVLDAVKALTGHTATVKVPTRDGGWAWPTQVFDIEEALDDGWAAKTLDRDRCMPAVAHKLGVVRGPVNKYSTEDEPLLEWYREWILIELNSRQGPGERPIERIELYPGEGPGPFSMLFLLRDAGASAPTRASWTTGLLQAGDSAWTCEDLDTSRTYRVRSPVRWAVDRAGLLKTDSGFRPPAEVVAPSMLKYKNLLPLFDGPRQVAEALDLPDELDDVPAPVLKEALESELFPARLDNNLLVEFITTACPVAYPEDRPTTIPSRVGRAVEARSPASVYLATTDEQVEFLRSRQRPYLRVTDEQVDDVVVSVGCRRFEDSFAFSMLIEGQQESERVIDMFSGLRTTPAADLVMNATVSRALRLVKRVTTEDGVEDQSLEWHLDGPNLVVCSDAAERRLLSVVNDAFDLRLTNAELDAVLKAGLDQRLEALRQQARAASADAERLDVYFGPDDLRDALPRGLWPALEAQSLVDESTSVADLFLTVYGSDSVRLLADLFRNEGFVDVPNTWAGGSATISWLRKMGFGTKYAGHRAQPQDDEFVVPGAVRLNHLHPFQEEISQRLEHALTHLKDDGRHQKTMVELPTGAGKTRVAAQTVLDLFIAGRLLGPVLWIAQSLELCEQAVQTWSTVWRGLGDERPLTVGRLWENKSVHEPDTKFSVIVATDAKLDVIRNDPDYGWLSNAAAVIVDEGHRAGGSERYTRILKWLGVDGRSWQRPLIGLSATPFKGTSEEATAALASRFGDNRINVFGAENAYRRLAEVGVLARVQHEVLPGVEVVLEPHEIAATKQQRLLPQPVLDRVGADQARMAILVDHIMGLDESWPVLVFTPSVLSAQVLAATLRYRGVESAAVWGQTGRQERRDVIERFKEGEIRVLTNCDLLIQGFDAPGVRALYIARPTFSPNAYIQMAGRGLRGPANGGKEECLIVDVADNFGSFSDWLGYREYEDLWQEHRA